LTSKDLVRYIFAEMVLNFIAVHCNEALHKEYGFDVEYLKQHNSIKNQQAFWSIVQCQTDNLAPFYEREERRVRNAIKLIKKTVEELAQEEKESRDDNKCRLILLVESNVRLTIENLLRFLTQSIERYQQVLRYYDQFHNESIEEEEMELLFSSLSFLGGRKLRRLRSVLNAIDARGTLGIAANDTIVCIERERSSKSSRLRKGSSSVISKASIELETRMHKHNNYSSVLESTQECSHATQKPVSNAKEDRSKGKKEQARVKIIKKCLILLRVERKKES
jgi:hypothetical protein